VLIFAVEKLLDILYQTDTVESPTQKCRLGFESAGFWAD